MFGEKNTEALSAPPSHNLLFQCVHRNSRSMFLSGIRIYGWNIPRWIFQVKTNKCEGNTWDEGNQLIGQHWKETRLEGRKILVYAISKLWVACNPPLYLKQATEMWLNKKFGPALFQKFLKVTFFRIRAWMLLLDICMYDKASSM